MNKIYWILGGLVLVALIVWNVDSCRKFKQSKQDIAEVRERLKKAQADNEQLKKEINTGTTTIITAKPRPHPAPGQSTRVRSKTTLGKNWHFVDLDVDSDQPGMLYADTLIDDAIKPWKAVVKDYQKKLEAIIPPPVRFGFHGGAVGLYGISGADVLVYATGVDFGSSKFRVAPVAGAGVRLPTAGAMSGNAGIGVAINW